VRTGQVRYCRLDSNRIVMTRRFKIEGRALTLTTEPGPSAVGGRPRISILVWEKVD